MLTALPKGAIIHLWGSLPCTPWTQLTHLNLAIHPHTYPPKLRKLRLLSFKLIANFTKLGEYVLGLSGLNTVSFEWPRGAKEGWEHPKTVAMISKLRLSCTAHFDGCMLGTRSTAPSTLGEPIKKPWQVVSTSPGLVAELSLHVCDKGHVHTPCAGIDTLRTGFYTPELANVIVRDLIAPPALAKVSAATGGILPPCTPKQLRVLKHKHDHGFALTQPMLDLLSISGSVKTKTGSSSHANSSPPKLPYQAHPPRISDSPLGLVARLLTRADPEYKDPRVAIAMEKQISTLLRNSVWELVPREWSDVKAEARKNGEEVVIGRCFHIDYQAQ